VPRTARAFRPSHHSRPFRTACLPRCLLLLPAARLARARTTLNIAFCAPLHHLSAAHPAPCASGTDSCRTRRRNAVSAVSAPDNAHYATLLLLCRTTRIITSSACCIQFPHANTAHLSPPLLPTSYQTPFRHRARILRRICITARTSLVGRTARRIAAYSGWTHSRADITPTRRTV